MLFSGELLAVSQRPRRRLTIEVVASRERLRRIFSTFRLTVKAAASLSCRGLVWTEHVSAAAPAISYYELIATSSALVILAVPSLLSSEVSVEVQHRSGERLRRTVFTVRFAVAARCLAQLLKARRVHGKATRIRYHGFDLCTGNGGANSNCYLLVTSSCSGAPVDPSRASRCIVCMCSLLRSQSVSLRKKQSWGCNFEIVDSLWHRGQVHGHRSSALSTILCLL